jgi:hypothetical protein
MGRKVLILLLIIGAIYVGTCAFGMIEPEGKIVRSSAISVVKAGASGAPIPKKTTSRLVVTVKPKATATPRSTTKAKTTTPAKATTKPVSTNNKTNHSYSVTIGGSTNYSIMIGQGQGATISVKEDGIEVDFSILLGNGNGLLYTSGKRIVAKYDKGVTSRRTETITITYANKTTGKFASIKKAIVIEPHTTHSFGSWRNGPANNTQERTCTICGYVDVMKPLSVVVSPSVIRLLEGRSQKITVNISGYGEGELTKTFSSSDTKVAMVTKNGGVVTARNYGTAIITINIGKGTNIYKTVKCTVNVECSHKRTEKYYIIESDIAHKEARRCIACSTIVDASDATLKGHTWSTSWVANAYGVYTHICTKCGALGGSVKSSSSFGSSVNHAYYPSNEWSYNKEYHWHECVYPYCNMTSHKTIGNLPSNAGCKKHAFRGSGADGNKCSECTRTRDEINDYLKVKPTPTPCIHEYEEFIYKYEENPISLINQPNEKGHYVEYKCKNCGQSDPDRPKELIGHPSINHFVKNDADWHKCSVCDWEGECEYDDNNIEYQLTATCETDGYLIGYQKCLHCKNQIEGFSKEVSAYGHEYDPNSAKVGLYGKNNKYIKIELPKVEVADNCVGKYVYRNYRWQKNRRF